MESEERRKECTGCGEEAVAFDYLQGFLVCEACGKVEQESELVSQIYSTPEERSQGTFVSSKDTGLDASVLSLAGTAAGRVIQRARPYDPVIKMRKAFKELSSKLALPPNIHDEAMVFVEQLAELSSGWKRNHVAAAAAYLAIRNNQLPLTLMDLASVMHDDMYQIGRAYRHAMILLNVRPPEVQPVNLLSRTIDRVMPGHPLTAAVRQDAESMLKWMDIHLCGSRHPLGILGAAIILSSEMNNVPIRPDQLCDVLRIWIDTLTSKLLDAKQKLLSFAQLLPHSSKITIKNVGTYARTIVRLTSMLEASQQDDVNEDQQPPAKLLPPPPPSQQQKTLQPSADEGDHAAGKKRQSSLKQIGKPSKDKKVRFSDTNQYNDNEYRAADEVGPHGNGLAEEDDDEHLSDFSDSEIDVYLRSEEEVKLVAALFSVRENE